MPGKDAAPPVLADAVRGDTLTRDRSEDAEVAEIVSRLERRYAGERVSVTDLDRRVRGIYHQFDTARIRTYIFILVERLARRSVEDPAASLRAG